MVLVERNYSFTVAINLSLSAVVISSLYPSIARLLSAIARPKPVPLFLRALSPLVKGAFRLLTSSIFSAVVFLRCVSSMSREIFLQCYDTQRKTERRYVS